MYGIWNSFSTGDPLTTLKDDFVNGCQFWFHMRRPSNYHRKPGIFRISLTERISMKTGKRYKEKSYWFDSDAPCQNGKLIHTAICIGKMPYVKEKMLEKHYQWLRFLLMSDTSQSRQTLIQKCMTEHNIKVILSGLAPLLIFD